MSWFKFGGIRGLIGFVIATIQLIALKAVLLPSLLPGIQVLIFGANLHTTSQYLNTTIIPSMVQQNNYIFGVNLIIGVISLIIAAAIAYMLMGLAYYIGVRIVNLLELKTKGFWKAAAAGVLGVLVLGLVAVLLVIVIYSFLIEEACPPDQKPICGIITSGLIAALIASIPSALVAEVGYAAVTWQLYKQIGWKLPE